MNQRLSLSSVAWATAFVCFSILPAALCLDDLVTSSADSSSPGRSSTGDKRAKRQPSAEELSSPLLFLKQLQLQDDVKDGTENIRHERQIKFKSSYRELPEALKKAEKKQNKGKSIDSAIEIIPDETISENSSSLKELPSSSEIYFQPEVRNLESKALAKHFGKLSSRNGGRAFKARRQKPFSSGKPFKKRARLVKKKMVGRKLIKQLIPNPKRVDLINFQSSSTDKIENTVTRTARRPSLKFAGRRNTNNNSQTRNGRGPNPDKTFHNPHYIDTPSNEVSSYSFVPENSFVGKRPRKQKSSPSPVPKKVSRVTSRGRRKQHKTKAKQNQFFGTRGKSLQVNNAPAATKRTKLKRRKPSEPNKYNVKVTKLSPSTESWAHFFRNQQPRNEKQKQKTQPRRTSSPRKAKSFTGNRITQSMEKRVRQKTGYPDLISVPATNFSCGRYNSGEYIADTETKCQVFHVCFGGRRASFVCPVGTAFSQDLLVCDWWHKVDCGQLI